jgi:RNA polymerase sigma-70 factor (ECF subfamily)
MPLDEATLAQLLVREHDKLAAYCWSLVRDDHLVDDILQELALLAIRKRDEIQDVQHFLAWMRVTCRLTALDLCRRLDRQAVMLEDSVLSLLDAEWAAHDATPSDGLLEALRHCLEGLAPYGRKLLEMRYHDGWKSAKIAEATQREVQSIYVALTRVHRALRECIDHRMNEEGSDA